MADSLFTKIIKGEIPAYKIYEDELTFSFLTIEPISPGHTLVVPKKQVDQIWDLDKTDYDALMSAVKKVGLRIREVYKPLRVGIHVQGLDVPHVHVHVFAFNSGEEFLKANRPQATDESLAAEAKKLAF